MLVNFTNEENQTASAPMQMVHLTHSAGLLVFTLPSIVLFKVSIVNLIKKVLQSH
jgi:hypothetical protein